MPINSTTRQAIYFTAPYKVEVQSEPIASPGPGQVLVQAMLSAISPGTERLIYRGQVPLDMALDETIADLRGQFRYPFKYGYTMVGQVVALGAGVAAEWQGRLVFAFHPHESHFITTPNNLWPLPPHVTPEAAIFLPNMETAVNLLLDGAPIIGERVVVLGQGMVGLLTTHLLAQYPLSDLVTIEPAATRRNLSLALGARRTFEPLSTLQLFDNGADLIYELSGNPDALNQAIDMAGFDSRIIVGSWYGTKLVTLNLGGCFHRQRIRLISSQVSTLTPHLSGRWNKARRLELAWQRLLQLQPSQFITHRFPISQAVEAYALLEANPNETVQIVLTY